MSYSKFKFFFSSDEEGTFWPGVVELPVDNEVSSVEPANDENKNQRIITGVILFAILSLFFISKLSAFILFVLVAFIAAKEWFDLFEYSIFIPYPLLLFSALAPLLVVYFYELSNIFIPYFIFPLGLIIYLGFYTNFSIYEKFGSAMVFHSWFSIGIASIGWLLKSQELIFVYLSIIAIATSDIFAYEIGKRIGSRKLAENISPNKTLEGFLAGLFIGTLFMTLNIAINLDKSYLSSFLVSIVFISLGVVGDLFMSKIKRSIDVKDSGTIFPGHGGLLDRIDSYLISFPYLLIVLQFFYLNL
ncbi:MAG: phosphatidate cytidylyltransferase [Actinomycetota bacterium]|nr:MAG: phosphatidate cytidylyltransferase [Actinomycetota bacterium]